jgi:hypothetical protein
MENSPVKEAADEIERLREELAQARATSMRYAEYSVRLDDEIAALKARPAQEPVAWMHIQGNYEEAACRQLTDSELARGWEQRPLIYGDTPQPSAEVERLYNELLYAVQRMYPNESRHETALRYIRRMEEPSDNPAMGGK